MVFVCLKNRQPRNPLAEILQFFPLSLVFSRYVKNRAGLGRLVQQHWFSYPLPCEVHVRHKR